MNCRWSLNQSNFQNWIVVRVDYVIMCTICTFVLGLYSSHIKMNVKKQTKNKNFFFTTNDNNINHKKRRINKEEYWHDAIHQLFIVIIVQLNTPTASIIQIPYSVVKQIQNYILAHWSEFISKEILQNSNKLIILEISSKN